VDALASGALLVLCQANGSPALTWQVRDDGRVEVPGDTGVEELE
jgi:hypothetical protein